MEGVNVSTLDSPRDPFIKYYRIHYCDTKFYFFTTKQTIMHTILHNTLLQKITILQNYIMYLTKNRLSRKYTITSTLFYNFKNKITITHYYKIKRNF